MTLSGTSLYQNYLDYKKKQCNKKAGNQSAPTDSELGLTDKETAPTVNQWITVITIKSLVHTLHS